MNGMAKYPCPVCGSLEMSEPIGSFDICPVCGWEDDYLGQENPDDPICGTHPTLSLNGCRKAWNEGKSIWPNYPNPKKKE